MNIDKRSHDDLVWLGGSMIAIKQASDSKKWLLVEYRTKF